MYIGTWTVETYMDRPGSVPVCRTSRGKPKKGVRSADADLAKRVLIWSQSISGDHLVAKKRKSRPRNHKVQLNCDS